MNTPVKTINKYWIKDNVHLYNDLDDITDAFNKEFQDNVSAAAMRKRIKSLRDEYLMVVKFIKFESLTDCEKLAIIKLIVDIVEPKVLSYNINSITELNQEIIKEIENEAINKIASEYYRNIEHVTKAYRGSAETVYEYQQQWHQNHQKSSNIQVQEEEQIMIPSVNTQETPIIVPNVKTTPTSVIIPPNIEALINDPKPNPFTEISNTQTEEDKLFNEIANSIQDNQYITRSDIPMIIAAFHWYIKSLNIKLTETKIKEILLLILSNKVCNSENYITEQLIINLNPDISGRENINKMCKCIKYGNRINVIDSNPNYTVITIDN